MISENSMMSIPINENNVVSIPSDVQDFEFEDYDLMDDKDREKYITDLERHIRSSFEYRQMVQYLREYMNMNSCAFIPNISNETNRKIKIELHHSPFTLRDICCVILNKRMKNVEMLTIESVAYEVMFVHYSLMVGLIPLSETVHELVHSQYLFIPTNKVYGYYKAFVNSYKDYIDEELLDKLAQLEKLTKEGTYNDTYKQVLEKKYITIDMEDNNQIEKLHELQGILKQRLSEIKEADKPQGLFAGSNIMHPDNHL
jgi:hypothetical protein